MLMPVFFLLQGLITWRVERSSFALFHCPATKPVGTVCIRSGQDKSGVSEHSLGEILVKAVGMSLFFSKGSFFLFVLVCRHLHKNRLNCFLFLRFIIHKPLCVQNRLSFLLVVSLYPIQGTVSFQTWC